MVTFQDFTKFSNIPSFDIKISNYYIRRHSLLLILYAIFIQKIEIIHKRHLNHH